MTLDEAYLEVLGKTFNEFKKQQESMIENLKKQEEEYKKSIPTLTEKYKEKARGIIREDKIDYWDEIVPIRLNDLYRGMELDATLEIIKALDVENVTLEEAKNIIDKQGHSGTSFSLVCLMIKEFSKRGEEFVAYVK